jgi:hypothetical protein
MGLGFFFPCLIGSLNGEHMTEKLIQNTGKTRIKLTSYCSLLLMSPKIMTLLFLGSDESCFLFSVTYGKP